VELDVERDTCCAQPVVAAETEHCNLGLKDAPDRREMRKRSAETTS